MGADIAARCGPAGIKGRSAGFAAIWTLLAEGGLEVVTWMPGQPPSVKAMRTVFQLDGDSQVWVNMAAMADLSHCARLRLLVRHRAAVRASFAGLIVTMTSALTLVRRLLVGGFAAGEVFSLGTRIGGDLHAMAWRRFACEQLICVLPLLLRYALPYGVRLLHRSARLALAAGRHEASRAAHQYLRL